MPGPLRGIRVADFSEYIAAPYATMVLADLGAEVIKIEPPGGDGWRHSLPLEPGYGRGFLQFNRSKRSIGVDLKSAAGREVAHDIVRRSDVVVTNARPGVAERLGIGYEQLSAIQPELIYCQNTAFGRSGPYAERGGFDLLSQAAAGIIVYEGTLHGGRTGVGALAPGDYSAGLFMALGVVSALYARAQGAGGQRIDMSLLDAAIASQYRPLLSVEADDAGRDEFLAAWRAAIDAGASFAEALAVRGEVRRGRIENPYYRVYRTANGFVAVACLNNALRRRLRDAVGFEDATVEGLVYEWPTPEAAAAVTQAAEAALLTRPTAAWMAAFDAVGVPCGPVNAPEEVPDDPQVGANGAIWRLQHARHGEIRMPASPLRMSATPVEAPRLPPALGADTAALLAELGYAEPRIAELVRDGVVVAAEPS